MATIKKKKASETPDTPAATVPQPPVELNKFVQGTPIVLPCVLDAINYEKHIVLDVVQLKVDVFKKGTKLIWNNETVEVAENLSQKKVKTINELDELNKMRKVRYYCKKL